MTLAVEGPASTGEAVQEQPRRLTGSRIMCEVLEREGVGTIWGYPGGAIMPFYDALSEYDIHHVLVRHEQAGAHAADGYARATGNVGVCIGTSGPGATNLVTGLATAYMDSVPMVAITGQVARAFIGHDSFQETDIVGITLPITKHSFLVNSAAELGDIMHEAFHLARSGRPGPVLVDVPKDVQMEEAEYVPAVRPPAPPTAQQARYAEAAALIDSARKPLLIAGHGVILANAYTELRTLAERTGVPVITTLLGLSCFPESHPLSLGWPGMHGPAHVNRAIDQADLIVAVGMRFDDRITGNLQTWAPNARFVHVDIDPAEINKNVKVAVGIVADARDALASLAQVVAPNDHTEWLESIKSQARPGVGSKDTVGINPSDVIEAVKSATNGEARLVTDVGQHQMWVARYYGYDKPNSHITSGGLGTMGYALPAAMGVKVGCPNEPVWVVAGDGGIQMNIQELGTLVQENLELKIAIINNGYLGMVRQWQEFFHNRNYSETRISSPNYEHLCAAYGLQARVVHEKEDVGAAVAWAMETPGSVILDFRISQEANVYPMIPSGGSVASMIEEAEVIG